MDATPLLHYYTRSTAITMFCFQYGGAPAPHGVAGAHAQYALPPYFVRGLVPHAPLQHAPHAAHAPHAPHPVHPPPMPVNVNVQVRQYRLITQNYFSSILNIVRIFPLMIFSYFFSCTLFSNLNRHGNFIDGASLLRSFYFCVASFLLRAGENYVSGKKMRFR